MKQILIVEDEEPAFRRLEKLLKAILPDATILDQIDSVENAVKWLRHHRTPDLIFLDIQLADGLSFEIFDQVNLQTPIIFTTAYDEYALQAFKVNSIDYLLKPIDPQELAGSMNKLEQLKKQFETGIGTDLEKIFQSLQQGQNQEPYKSRFLVKLGDRLISLAETEIAYFYADQKIVILVSNDHKKYAINYTLDELERLLDPQFFFRLNRQYITRIQAIDRMHHYFKSKIKVYLKPEAEQEIVISRERSPIFKKWLDQ